MDYYTDLDQRIVGLPKIRYLNHGFLSAEEIVMYQNLLKNHRWCLGNDENFEKINYVSQDLYDHYRWDGQWQSARWLAHAPIEWETLYNKIAHYLPSHYLHWVDVKITGFGQSGTLLHRDKDPWAPGGDEIKFKKSITVICNLNTEWLPEWGGGLVLYSTDIQSGKIINSIDQIVPVVPGQLLITDNCYHSIEPIVEPTKNRISFILHVLEYNNDSN